ncbi:MAG: GIY-YIG nuclease family protein [Pseudomonadales bacterium]|nr:GIY-YIG nuclease family protein [Pseudomonadales bacterium]
MLRSADSRLYTGITTDLGRRLEEHRQGGRRGAKALRGRAPLELVYNCAFRDRSSASVAEYRVKQLSRIMKERLVAGDISLQTLISDDESENGC